MSRTRYDWWGYVKGMIRRYPALRDAADEARAVSITPRLSGTGGHGGDGRTTETAALRELRGVQRRELDAVCAAVNTTARYRDGRERLELVRLVFWSRTHTLEGAAMHLHVSYRTASGWHGEFIRLVASNYGLLD